MQEASPSLLDEVSCGEESAMLLIDLHAGHGLGKTCPLADEHHGHSCLSHFGPVAGSAVSAQDDHAVDPHGDQTIQCEVIAEGHDRHGGVDSELPQSPDDLQKRPGVAVEQGRCIDDMHDAGAALGQ